MNRTRAISIAIAPLALVTFGACSSTTSGSGAGSGGSSGSGSGSGGSSGSSSGSSSGGGSGGSSGSASSSSGSGSGSGSGGSSGSSSGGNGDTQLASGLTGIQSLIVAGSNLAWIDSSKTSIMTMPIAGGSMPKVVLTDANLAVDIAWDGTSIFFLRVINGKPELDSIGLDGSGQKTLASGFSYIASHLGKGSELFVAGGNVYFAGYVIPDGAAYFGAIFAVPTTGGSWSIAVQGMGAAFWSFNETELLWADASGAYFNYLPTNGGGTVVTGYATLGGTPAVLTGVDTPHSGNFTAVNGAAYYTDDSITGGFTAKLQKVTPGGAPSTVATYMGEEGTTLAADGSGMFMFATGMANGVYTVDPSSGAQTPFDSANNDLDTAVFALDSKNLYFVEVSAGKYSIWSKAR